MQGSGRQRQARLRLTRQRTRPDRARSRQRSERPLRWWRRIPWAAMGAVIGATAAIGGLGGTAIATYYGAEVSDAIRFPNVIV